VVGEIPNDSDFADRGDGYIPMLHAIKGAGGDTWDAFETWEWWCGQVPQYPEDEPQKRWDTVHDTAQAPIKLGFSKLLEWALRRGDAQALAKLVFGLPQIAERLAVDGRLDEGGGEHPREVVDRVVDTGGAKKKPRSLGDVTALARAGLRAIAAPVAKDVYEELAANDEHDLPEIIMPGIERMESTLIGGPSGAMKSLFVQQAAVAATVSAPKPIGEKAVDFCGPAVFYANEDSPRLVKKRINAICLKHGLTRPYKHKLFVRTGQVLKRNDKGAIDWNWDEVNALLDILAQEGDIAMIVLDTLAASLPSEETNLEFQQVIDKTRELAREIRAAVVIVHHFRKGTPGGKEEEPTLEAVRGGSALTAAARNVMFAEKPNKADKVKYGLTDDQAKTTMKLTHVKCSYGPLSPTKWFKLDTAPIKVRDRRDGSLGHEDQPALIPIALSDVQHRLGVLRDAWNKLDAWIKSGQRVFQSSASRGKPGFAQAVLGVKSDRETNEILSDLVKHDIIEIVETTDGGHKKREIISRNLGFSARLEEVDEDVENTEETPY
jgi:hypothetical protein